MVEYLKTKKGYFYKIKNGKKKRISREEYNKQGRIKQGRIKTRNNKTRKNKKKIGGVLETIIEITEHDDETEFEQRYAVINYGSGKISTHSLVNCLAIGGVFKIDKNYGTFLTHESPKDYKEQIEKLSVIKTKLDAKSAEIIKIVIFSIDKPAHDVYTNGSTTKSIINDMKNYCERLFSLSPYMSYYSCNINTLSCGKAIISPSEHITKSTRLRLPKTEEEPTETFIVNVLYNKNEKIYMCPSCKIITGTLAPKYPTRTYLFSHMYDCPNKNKIPIEK